MTEIQMALLGFGAVLVVMLVTAHIANRLEERQILKQNIETCQKRASESWARLYHLCQQAEIERSHRADKAAMTAASEYKYWQRELSERLIAARRAGIAT